jgi:hypothetical protein
MPLMPVPLRSARYSLPSTIIRFLAETYSSEASCALGKLEDAMHVLQSQYSLSQEASSTSSIINSKNFPQYFFTDNSYPTGSSRKGPNGDGLVDPQGNSKCHPATGEDVSYQKLTSSVNFATALSLQGNFSRAQSILESLLELCPTFAPGIKLLSYLMLRRGQHMAALSILKGGHYSADSVGHEGS